ncbi:agmatine deiminase family protein [Streptomyces sp. NA04227]|uniref:agmatine deiminase family protein n=1 Tax=Streptomyces sp. NA04227 TaxID=2742136 RepID=UPI001590BE48|nr:agmatine deiminase family protein [Streptomyces sp. NA04227]QKW09850.1 agmatine deiminase family protein [Streptomyces sp. NA04227]
MNSPRTPRTSGAPRLGRRGFLALTGLTAAGAAVTVAGRERAHGTPPRTSARAGFAVPLDTVPHTRTWMAWPDSSAIWGPQLGGVQADIALIARTVAAYEPVTMCANPDAAAKAREACGSEVTVIDSIPVDDCWMRDSGPVFRTDGSGGLDTVGLSFNGWGDKQTHARDALVAERIAAEVGVPFTLADFVGEGGAVETDGRGTLMATRSSLVNPNRNPDLTEQQIADAMCEAFGATQVIWFDGISGEDITDDHVDATSRFLAPAEGLVQLPLDSETGPWPEDAREQYRILSAASGAGGERITVTRLQGPDYDLIRSKDPDFLGSYANYYVCNGAVISAQFGDERADAAAKDTLQRLFPDRVVEQLNIDHLGAGGGGIHCVTQQEPKP